MRVYSNEIVFRGHPDKVCDQISDKILDECLSQDPYSRVAVETVGGKGIIFVTGEITTNAILDVQSLVKEVLIDVGYDPSEYTVTDNIGKQSPDISLGVDVGGAGDQGKFAMLVTIRQNCYLPHKLFYRISVGPTR